MFTRVQVLVGKFLNSIIFNVSDGKLVGLWNPGWILRSVRVGNEGDFKNGEKSIPHLWLSGDNINLALPPPSPHPLSHTHTHTLTHTLSTLAQLWYTYAERSSVPIHQKRASHRLNVRRTMWYLDDCVCVCISVPDDSKSMRERGREKTRERRIASRHPCHRSSRLSRFFSLTLHPPPHLSHQQLRGDVCGCFFFYWRGFPEIGPCHQAKELSFSGYVLPRFKL